MRLFRETVLCSKKRAKRFEQRSTNLQPILQMRLHSYLLSFFSQRCKSVVCKRSIHLDCHSCWKLYSDCPFNSCLTRPIPFRETANISGTFDAIIETRREKDFFRSQTSVLRHLNDNECTATFYIPHHTLKTTSGGISSHLIHLSSYNTIKTLMSIETGTIHPKFIPTALQSSPWKHLKEIRIPPPVEYPVGEETGNERLQELF